MTLDKSIMPPEMLSNEELERLIQKAAIVSATGGQLSASQSEEFVNLMIDQNAVLQNFRVETGIERQHTIDGLEFGEPVIVAGIEATAVDAADVTVPAMPRLTLTPKEVVAAIDISYDFLRQNIRRSSAEADLERAIAKRIGMDLVNLVFNGDTATAGSTRQAKALKILDGILKKMRADASVHDTTVAATPSWGGSGGEFSKALTALPKEYRDDRSSLAHLVSVDVLDKYEDEIANRQTAAADNVLFGPDAVTRHKRVDVIAPYGFPMDTIVTTVKRNLVIGFGRNMEIYKQQQGRKRVLEVTMVMDVDCGYIFGNAAVLSEKA